jgi:ureidoacrylate peracid hydrolase
METWVSEVLDPQTTAVVVVDVQHDFCAPNGAFARGGFDITSGRQILPPLAELLTAARASGVKLVYLRFVEDASGHVISEAYDRQRYRAGNTPRYCIDEEGKSIVPEVAPKPGEAVIDKVRASGFFNTALDTVLRCSGIRTIVLTGMATDSCVLATAIDATARDYYVVLALDCLASFSSERHDAALKILKFKHPSSRSEGIAELWRTKSSSTYSHGKGSL